MRKRESHKKLVSLLNKLKPQLIAAGINEETSLRFLAGIESKTDEAIELYIDSIISLTMRGGAYHGFMAIYGLQTPSYWKHMELLGETDLREHKLLKIEAKKLKLAWRELHNVSSKSRPKPNSIEGNLEGVELRSEE